VVARLGGDEFVVLCEDTTPSEARQTVERIRAALTEPIDVAGNGASLVIGVSVGFAVAGNAAGSAEDLLREADAAMYTDKATRSLLQRDLRSHNTTALT
jgi:diguanylate cyclase (GGDEF)-like protein